MGDRPEHATHGDFALDTDGHVRADGTMRLTYAGLGVYRPQLLDGWKDIAGDIDTSDGKPRFRLAPILKAHMAFNRISGEYHGGRWTDVGTPERLARLDAELTSRID